MYMRTCTQYMDMYSEYMNMYSLPPLVPPHTAVVHTLLYLGTEPMMAEAV